MSELQFLCCDRAQAGGGFEPVPRSPLERALRGAPPGIRDVSLEYGKIEVRGDVASLNLGAGFVRVTRERALVFCPYAETGDLRAELQSRFDTVVDMTGALAGIEVEGEQLMRRLTDLDLRELPAVAAVARIPGVVLRDGETFRIFFPQEYGHYLGEVVVDAAEGLL